MVSRYNIWYYYWVVMDMLCYRFPCIARFYEHTIGNAYYQELDQFDVYQAKHILHIGCGSYPLTALIINAHTKATIVSIDKNEIAVTLSKRFIQQKQLTHHIIIDKSDGRHYPLQDFDTIIISGCSIPMFDLIDHIFTSATPGTQIIVRLNDDQYTMFTDFVQSYTDIIIKKEIENVAYPRFTWTSLLVEKQQQ